MSNQPVELQNVELLFGLKDKKIVSVNDVEQGLDCGCFCPHCNSRLVAKKGSIRQHHFAHYESDDCQHGPETTLHLLAKQVIKEHEKVLMPSHYDNYELEDSLGINHQNSSYLKQSITHLSQVEIEKPLEGYQPDVSAITENGEPLDIEILVTHAVDEEKSELQAQSHRKMIEIDLSMLPRTSSYDEIVIATLYEAPRKFISSDEKHLKTEITNKVDIINQSHSSHAKIKAMQSPTEGKVILMGYKFGEGYSPRYKSQFSLGHLFFIKPVQSTSTKNFTLKASDGNELATRDVHENVLEQLEGLELPALVSLTFEAKHSIGHNTKFIVTGIKSEDL